MLGGPPMQAICCLLFQSASSSSVRFFCTKSMACSKPAMSVTICCEKNKDTTLHLSSILWRSITKPECNYTTQMQHCVRVCVAHPPELIQGAQHLLQLGHLLSGGCSLAVPIQVLGELWKEMTPAELWTNDFKQITALKAFTREVQITETCPKAWQFDPYLLHSSESCSWNQSHPVGSPASSFFAPYPEMQLRENLRHYLRPYTDPVWSGKTAFKKSLTLYILVLLLLIHLTQHEQVITQLLAPFMKISL